MNIELITRDNCEFCAKAKEFLAIEQIAYYEYNLTKGDITRDEVYAKLGKSTDEKVTLPVVFIDTEYIGGYVELAEYFAGLAIERQALTEALKNGVLHLEFIKADGSLRKMNATLNKHKIFNDDTFSSFREEDENKGSPHKLSVYDIDKSAWRSFRFDRLKSWKQVELS